MPAASATSSPTSRARPVHGALHRLVIMLVALASADLALFVERLLVEGVSAPLAGTWSAVRSLFERPKRTE